MLVRLLCWVFAWRLEPSKVDVWRAIEALPVIRDRSHV